MSCGLVQRSHFDFDLFLIDRSSHYLIQEYKSMCFTQKLHLTEMEA